MVFDWSFVDRLLVPDMDIRVINEESDLESANCVRIVQLRV